VRAANDADILLQTMPGPPSEIDPGLHEAWRAAALRTAQADPFCCMPYWQLAFHDAFSPGRRLLIREAEGSVIAFAEVVFSRQDIFLTPIEAHWFFDNPLLGEHAVELLAESLAPLREYYSPATPRILVGGVRPGSSVLRRLARSLGPRCHVTLFNRGVQCAASLESGLDGFLANRSANHRAKLKKSQARARDKGICFERHAPDSTGATGGIFARMQAVERVSWKGVGECGMDQEPARTFYRLLLDRLARDRLARVIFARHGEADIGYVFGGLAGTVYRGQQFSYDNAWKDFSIGNLLQVEQVRWLCEEGATRYDLGPSLGDAMAYKSHWSELSFDIATHLIEPRP
jgi:hypothetical protein